METSYMVQPFKCQYLIWTDKAQLLPDERLPQLKNQTKDTTSARLRLHG